MRVMGLMVSGVLAVAVVAEGAYIVHTRRQVDRLSHRLEVLGPEAEDPLAGLDLARVPERLGDLDSAGVRGGAPATRLPPPRLVTTPVPTSAEPSPAGDSLPLPAAIDTPEGREQLRRFVVAALERERQENRLRDEEQQQERVEARRQRMVAELGLSPPETEKFNQILNQVQTARAAVRARIESGELPREAIGRELAAAREENQRQLRALLGDERLKKLEQLRAPGLMQGDRRPGGWGGPRERGRDRAARAPGGAPAP
jgi:hypothetical protein